MSDFTDLLWDGATRDLDDERTQLARTAALTDAEAHLGNLLYTATTRTDLYNRIALAEDRLSAIADRRSYDLTALAGDLTSRWEVLQKARSAAADEARQKQSRLRARQQNMDAAVSHLAALAARENPHVPMRECLGLAAEAVAKHADAYPLAYESWNHTPNGPFTDRAKNFKPPSLPGTPSTPQSPAAATPPAQLQPDPDDLDKPFADAAAELKPKWDSLTGSATLRTDAAWDWSQPFREVRDRLKDRWDHTTGDPTGQRADADWAHDHEQWNRDLDDTQRGLNERWDANAASPGASPHHTPAPAATDGLLDGFDQARDEMNHKWDANAAAPGASPAWHQPAPATFSDTPHHTPLPPTAEPAPPATFSDHAGPSGSYQMPLGSDTTPVFSHPA